ncbi:Molybdopterin biosynthesis MoaE [Dendrothele bispora CBS 962.96]|uniref:Molybdopterin biosynthesis MoaE n=1 Tax=Dendrothele bispora (strain CBS 962.96) TaxID=1314807 RepID=A0A4S8MX19_DENBC|nr:Molybdopterin biosynthesis MoaE [Dendrothele bispora CBS 962.96]
MSSMILPSASFETRSEIAGATCALSYTLDVPTIIQSVNDGAGANVHFIGTTRNSFQGKVVTRLEYQAYSKLAIKTMAEIVGTAFENFKPIRCAVHHRLGTVPVGEPSIVVAVSAPHRKEAFRACEFILEEVKRKAQIWKRGKLDIILSYSI